MHRPWILLVCALIALTLAGESAWGTAQDESHYSRYTIEATFDPERHTIGGWVTVEYLNDSGEPLDAIVFLLLPNYDRSPNPYLDPAHIDALYPQGFDPAWTRIHEVTGEGGQALNYELLTGPATFQTYSLEETVLRVELAQPLPSGGQTTVKLRFTTKFPLTLWGDQSRFRGVYTWRFGWYPLAVPAGELQGGRYLSPERPYYRFVYPAALYELSLTLPREFRAAIGADHRETISEADGQKTIHALSASPVRSVPINLSTDFQVYRLPHPQVELVVYFLPGHEEAARLIATYAAESLDYFRQRWGEYPHRRLVITETPSGDASFSGASADAFLLLNRRWFEEKDLAVHGFANRLLDFLVAHEVAHQWWGVGIGADLDAERFLSESFAQYFSITYFEEKYGAFEPNVFRFERPGLMERFAESQFGYLNLREHLQGELPYMSVIRDRFDEAIIKPQKELKFAQASSERIYNKGYLMLRALSGFIGEGTMDELLKAAYERFLDRVATAEEFEALAESVAGRELDVFFDQAFHQEALEEGRAPYADYGVERVETAKEPGGTYEHRVFLFRRGTLVLPVDVVAQTRAGTQQTRSWRLEDQEEGEYVMVFQTPSPLSQVEVDPKHLVPDVDRLNNIYVLEGLSLGGRKVKLIPTGENAFPLEAYLIRVNPIDQVIEGGYLLDHRWWLGNRFVAFAKDLGRGSAASGIAGLLGDRLIGQLTWERTTFSHPEVGLQGRFWEPSERLRLTFLRRPDLTGDADLDEQLEATGRMLNVLAVSWTHQEQLSRRIAWWTTVENDPNAFTRLEIGGAQVFRVAPGVDLGGRLSLGWGEGRLGIFHPTLAELVSHRTASAYPYPGRVRLLGELDLSFPFQRELGYDLLGVAMLHRVDERFYLRFGGTWEGLVQVAQARPEELKAELGAEFTLSGRTLGGFFPWSVTLGFAYPLGMEEGAPRITQYLRVSTPIF